MINKNNFSCKINDCLISEYDVSIDGFSTDNSYAGIYWEAAVHFDNDDFTLNALAERSDKVKEIEVLRFPLTTITEVRIFESSYGSVKKDFKLSAIIGTAVGISVLLSMLLNPEPGYTHMGFILPVTLFLGFGITVVIFMILFFHHPSDKNICIKLITNDKRLIRLYIETEQKKSVLKILSKYFNEVKNKGFPYWEIDLN